MGIVSEVQRGRQIGNTAIDEGKVQLGIRELRESGVREQKDQPDECDKSQNQHEEVILPDTKSESRCQKPNEEGPGISLGNPGF